jgi:hypothetical protein
MSGGRSNPRLMALQQRVLAERRRRGDDGYNDEQVKRVAVYVAMFQIDLGRITAAESLAIAAELGLCITDYITAVAWLDPEHAALLRKQQPYAVN